jgi:hypothetical protein
VGALVQSQFSQKEGDGGAVVKEAEPPIEQPKKDEPKQEEAKGEGSE